jgi:hypothetical protein
MGIIEKDDHLKTLLLQSDIYLYGEGISEIYRKEIEEEIETLWNEPNGIVIIKKEPYQLRFKIQSFLAPDLKQEMVFENSNPKNNYIRIEATSNINISFVDGLGCNTGYFFTENLYKGSTTAAHEYGHTIGLDHPEQLDIRGEGIPGIMYPRGTLVDAGFQYDPSKDAGITGGTMHPKYRRVRQKDIDDLRINKLDFRNNTAVIGAFSSIWHEAH